MPDERIIGEIEQILTEIVELGAEKERTKLVPNLLVTNASPVGLTNFIVVRDDRDGDNILATKVPGIVYSTNDLVNVLFVKGGEAIAFQQGSASSSSGIWGIVLGSSTDIFYNAGDVVIGKTSAPDAALEILDTAQSQLRLTHTDATKFVDFTLDTNHDLTIDPSSTGQIILASDDVVIQEDLIHSGDTDTKIIFTADDIEFQAGALSMLKLTEAGQDLITLGPGSGDVDIDFNGDMFLEGSTGRFAIGDATPIAILEIGDGGSLSAVSPLIINAETSTHIIQVTSDITTSGSPQILRFVPVIDPTGAIASIFGANISPRIGGTSSNGVTTLHGISMGLRFQDSYAGTVTTLNNIIVLDVVDASSATPVVTTQYGLFISELTYAGTNWAVYTDGATESYFGGQVGLGINPSHTLELGDDDAAKTATTTWTTTSDKKVKRNIKPFSAGTDFIKALPEIKEFEYNGYGGTIKGQRGVGYLAQDLEKVAPKLIKYINKDLLRGGKGNSRLATFNPHDLIFALINTVIDLDARVTALEP